MSRFLPPILVAILRYLLPIPKRVAGVAWRLLVAALGLRKVWPWRLALPIVGFLARAFVPLILQRSMPRLAAVLANIILALIIALSGAGSATLYVAAQPSEEDFWFARMERLARAADAAYDAEIAANGPWTPEVALLRDSRTFNEPITPLTLESLLQSILHQIEEEGIVASARMPFLALFPWWVNSPAGTYDPAFDIIGINPRFIYDRGWRNNDNSWFSTLVHEMIHAQGVWAGPSEYLEAETETLTYEVMAGFANRNYPGASAEFLRGVRADALWTMWWIAQGRPVLSAIKDNGYFICNVGAAICEPTENAGRMAAWRDLRGDLMSPAELRNGDKSYRWWRSRPNKAFEAVIWKYVVPVLVPLVTNACTDGVLDEGYEIVSRRLLSPGDFGVYPFPLTHASVYEQAPLVVDDFAYILNELGAC